MLFVCLFPSLKSLLCNTENRIPCIIYKGLLLLSLLEIMYKGILAEGMLNPLIQICILCSKSAFCHWPA